MKLQSASLKYVALFLIGLLSVVLWSWALWAGAPAGIAQGWRQSDSSDNATSTVETSYSAPRIQDLSAFSFDFSAAPLIPTGLEHTDNPNEDGRGIINGDNRIPMTSRNYPWSAIGRIEGLKADGEQYICTGALITPEIVLTNAHCVYDPATHQLSQAIRFMPNLVNGRLQNEEDAAFVTDAFAGTDFSDGETPPHPNDWALVKLEKSLGSRYGTVGLASLAPATLITDYQGQLVLPGYSFDFPPENPSGTAGVHQGCSIVNQVSGVVVHDCDTRGGSSGGPILAEVDGEVRIVAVNSAEYANQETGVGAENYGVPASRIIAAIREQSTR